MQCKRSRGAYVWRESSLEIVESGGGARGVGEVRREAWDALHLEHGGRALELRRQVREAGHAEEWVRAARVRPAREAGHAAEAGRRAALRAGRERPAGAGHQAGRQEPRRYPTHAAEAQRPTRTAASALLHFHVQRRRRTRARRAHRRGGERSVSTAPASDTGLLVATLIE